MPGIAHRVGGPGIVGPTQEAVIPVRRRIPADIAAFDRWRKHERVGLLGSTAHVIRGGGPSCGTSSDLLLARLAGDDRRVIVEERVQLRVPVSRVGDLPRRGVRLDHADRGQRERHFVFIDAEVGAIEPAALLQVALEIGEKHTPHRPECRGVRCPRLVDVVSRSFVQIAEPVPPGKRCIDRDRLVDPDGHRQLHVLVEDVVIEFPCPVRPLGPFDHSPFDHIGIIGPGGMDGVSRDVLPTRLRIQPQMLFEQRFVLGRPGSDVIVPGDDPGILPQVQPELPTTGWGQGLVLNGYLGLKRRATLFGADVDCPPVHTGRRTGGDVQRQPDRPGGAGGQIEPLERLQPVRHEVGRVRIGRPAAHLVGAVGIVRYDIANEIDVHIAARQHVPFVVDEIAYRDADLAQRIRRPDDQLGIQPFAFPSGRFPQLRLLWQIRDLASEVRLIR